MFSRLLSSSFGLRKLAVLALCAWASVLASCSQNPITVNLHAMQASGRVSFLCYGLDNPETGHKLDECPDYEAGTRHTVALVTQTATNEVAVVDLAAQTIVDVDRTTPGYSFLRVGAKPESIVTTPGGSATFVAVSGLEKDGIFGLPTRCIMPPKGEGPDLNARDLTTWPACHLSSAPGDIAVVIDPVSEGDQPRVSCPNVELPPLKDEADPFCRADTLNETGPVKGRRKLLVALPEEHRLVLLDAQRLLDQQPGAFPECQIEGSFALDAPVPATYAQILPDDLKPADGATCPMPPAPPQTSMSALSTPGGLSALGDRVYVADRDRPVVHVLDVSDPCKGLELPPLLPLSYDQPARVVTTSRVAVSPLSVTKKYPHGQQFLYAIDEKDQPASVMVFDLTKVDPKNADTRTPVIFDGGPRQPFMPVDRLRFNAPVKDVSFVIRDFPKPDPTTGAGEFGLLCEPDPDAHGPGTLYRPNSDFSDGARPVNLRGMFGFAMLTNGQVAVVDADDFDAPCRRPVSSNMGPVEDIHGCANDPISAPYSVSGVPTVTGESSCHIVEPHRPRSASISISSSSNGLRAPSLRTFPQFTTPGPSLIIADQPRMMATDLDNPDESAASKTLPAQVYINSQLYANCVGHTTPPCDNPSNVTALDIAPVSTAPNSLTLPLVEPRSYAADQSPELVFEGSLFAARSSGYLDAPAMGASVAVFHDPDANFCGVGVEDSDTIRARGSALGIPKGSLDAWSKAHADYVQITGDFPLSDDPYWTVGHGQNCAMLINPNKAQSNRDACSSRFGGIDNPLVLNTNRDLSILEATANQLQVTPRNCTGDNCENTLKQIDCCFPAGTAYTVRASNQWLVTGTGVVGTNDMGTGPGNRCVHTASCDLRKQHYGQRVFEVCDPNNPGEDFKCEVTYEKVGCVGPNRDPSFPVTPGEVGSQCIFENLTSRFVVYHGSKPNVPNMKFSWQTTGGFVPQTMSLLSQSNSVNPQSLGYLPEQGWLAVVDGATLGLVLFDLNSLGVISPSPYF